MKHIIDVSKISDLAIVYNKSEITIDFNADDCLTVSIKKEKHSPESYKEIIEYLNYATGKSFKYTSRSARKYITARLNEGWSINNFKTVIETKASQWKYDKKMSTYLRPETLFSLKFEAYLNEEPSGLPIELYEDGTF